ncbi:cell surface protein [Corynebacterium sp. ACRQL]|uniref:cell surface protein n=1 Tax=Corynebacterium sp. ACRQL TaxID=2918191 RepID=UPI001EF5FF00|nr:cell surface protein [Corynebacterium sp. ACRQL]MCG7263531.1 cell surface protein [Corynebacterium sp. ACRQL]
MKLSKKITATAAATVLASAALLTPVANAQVKGGYPAPAEGDYGACEELPGACEEQPGEGEEQPGEGEEQPGEGEEQPGEGEDQPGADDENEPAGSSNMSKEDKIAAGIGGSIVGLGVLGAVLGNAGDKAEDEAEAPAEGEGKPEAPAEGEGKPEAPAEEEAEAPAADEEAPAEDAAEAPVAEAPAADAEAPAERNVQLANTGVKPEISILAGLALISVVAGAWMMFARRQA